MFGSAHVGYLLGHAAKAGEPEVASIFLRTRCLLDTHADTALGRVDLVDRKTSHFCRIPDKEYTLAYMVELCTLCPG